VKDVDIEMAYRTISIKFSCRKFGPCGCCVVQLWPNITGIRYFADIIGLSSTTAT